MNEDDPEIPRGTGRPKKRAWQTNGILTTGEGPQGKSVDLQADFEDAGVYTVQFGVPRPPPDGPPAFGTFAAYAEIIWKVEGGSVRRQISIGDGTEITAPAQGVEVHVQDAVTAFGAAGFDYAVHIQVVKGIRASITNPIRTPNFPFNIPITLAPLASVTIPIPRDCGITSVSVTAGQFFANPTPTNTRVEQIEGVVTLRIYDPILNPGFVAITPGTTAIKIDNFDPALPITVSCLFGVDG